jgi:hypothetical protein
VKLGTLLLRNAAIGLSQLEAALRNQVLYGGRLGTNLVELGFIDLELLSTYLSEMSGFPIASPSLLDDVDQELLHKLTADDAHRLRSVPLAYLGDGRDTAAVAIVETVDPEVIDELREKLGVAIKPYVVPELRALYYLEKHYGLPRRARFIRSGRAGTDPASSITPAEPPPDAANRRREQPAQGMVMPPAFTLAPRKRRASQAPLGQDVPVASSFQDACERVDTAQHREEIADALIDYARGRCDALVVLLIRDGNAFGWRGYVAPNATTKPNLTEIDELSLPLGGASSFQSAHDAGAPFVGAPPSAARPVEAKLWQALGVTPEPIEVVVVPILVKQRAVNLIYAHTLGGPPPQQLVTELTELATHAQTAYLRLIRVARGS